MSTRQFETTDNLNRYFKDIESISKPLTREDELDLATRISTGDIAAVNRLAEANMKFVVKLANGFIGLGASIDDLVASGNEGMLTAAQRFCPEKAKTNKFITYAQSWIRKMMHLQIDQAKVVKLPLNKEFEIYLKKKSGESPTLGKSISIDRPIGSETDSPTVGDSMVTRETDEVNISHNKWVVNQLTKDLSKEQMQIVTAAFGLSGEEPMTVKEISITYDLDPNYVSTILRHAKKQMKLRAAKVTMTRTFQSSTV
jgi:RNA polymerase primary sigma factor